jgi:putative membrane protein
MTPSRLLLAALAGAQILYPRVRSQPARRRATRAVVALALATSVAETVEARGARRGLALHGIAAALPFAAEVAGVATGRIFGAYRYGDGLGRKVAGVPLLAGAAWSLMARPAWVVGGLLGRRPVARVALGAGALTAWDVFLDPRMVREGYWTWPGGGRYAGVPASNYAGWAAVGSLLFTGWAALDGHDDPRDGSGDGALALYAWTWIGETAAALLFWRTPRVALAGAGAMGAFAVPALVARLRRGGR